MKNWKELACSLIQESLETDKDIDNAMAALEWAKKKIETMVLDCDKEVYDVICDALKILGGK